MVPFFGQGLSLQLLHALHHRPEPCLVLPICLEPPRNRLDLLRRERGYLLHRLREREHRDAHHRLVELRLRVCRERRERCSERHLCARSPFTVSMLYFSWVEISLDTHVLDTLDNLIKVDKSSIETIRVLLVFVDFY